MKSFGVSSYALSLGAAVISLAGCGGSQAPIGAPGAMPLSRTIEPERNVVDHVAGASSPYQVLHSFGYAYDGSMPDASLIDVNGTLYGTTEEGGDECGNDGCGTVFSISPSGAEHVLHSFGSGSDGAGPLASLIDVNGTLYGTTYSGGKYSWGTVFRITTTGKEHVLHSFDSTPFDGLNPYASMIDVNGTLYSTTANGGTDGEGTVFTISTTGKERVLHSFYGSDGEYPLASLLDVKGLLYGTAGDGGAHADGTVFSVSTTGTVHVLHSFSGRDGKVPSGSLIHVSGTLYGTTEAGGAYCEGKRRSGCGTVFSISTVGTEHVLYTFGSGHDGRQPAASLIDVNGTLYGTTYEGGTSNNGTVYGISTTGKERVLHSFGRANDGAVPSAGLIDVKGTLYGTTSSGGKYGKVPSSRRGHNAAPSRRSRPRDSATYFLMLMTMSYGLSTPWEKLASGSRRQDMGSNRRRSCSSPRCILRGLACPVF